MGDFYIEPSFGQSLCQNSEIVSQSPIVADFCWQSFAEVLEVSCAGHCH